MTKTMIWKYKSAGASLRSAYLCYLLLCPGSKPKRMRRAVSLVEVFPLTRGIGTSRAHENLRMFKRRLDIPRYGGRLDAFYNSSMESEWGGGSKVSRLQRA